MSDVDLFEIILGNAQDFLQQKGIEIVSEKTLMQSLPIIIECVELVSKKRSSGEEKKSLALRVILFILKQSSLEEEKKEVLRILVEEGTLETTIDIIISASKGEFELNRKTRRKLFVCMSECFDSLSKMSVRKPKRSESKIDEDEDEEEDLPEVFEEESVNDVKLTQSSMV